MPEMDNSNCQFLGIICYLICSAKSIKHTLFKIPCDGLKGQAL